MIRKKDTIKVKRKYSKTIVNRSGKPVEVERCVTRFVSGGGESVVSYIFPLDQGIFDIQPRHLPLILSRCDMEVIPEGKLRKDKASAKVRARIEHKAEVEPIESIEPVAYEDLADLSSFGMVVPPFDDIIVDDPSVQDTVTINDKET